MIPEQWMRDIDTSNGIWFLKNLYYFWKFHIKEFLKEILNHCNLQAKFRHDLRHSDNTFSLEFSKENGIKFINYIYSNSSIHLDRKYNKFLFFKNGSRPIQEWIGLLSGKIGESPIQDNPEVNIEIKKSISPYSVDNETSNRI